MNTKVTDEMVDAELAWLESIRTPKSGVSGYGIVDGFRAGWAAALSSQDQEPVKVQGDPVAHLVWRQARRAADDVEDYFEVARPGDKCVDGSDPFPVYLSAPLQGVETVPPVDHVAGWRPLTDDAKQGGRILLLWAPFSGVDEHIELGRWSAILGTWTNTYGKAFLSAPDRWSPLAPYSPVADVAVCPTCNGTGKEARHQLCRDCDEASGAPRARR